MPVLFLGVEAAERVSSLVGEVIIIVVDSRMLHDLVICRGHGLEASLAHRDRLDDPLDQRPVGLGKRGRGRLGAGVARHPGQGKGLSSRQDMTDGGWTIVAIV